MINSSAISIFPGFRMTQDQTENVSSEMWVVYMESTWHPRIHLIVILKCGQGVDF